MPTYEDAVRFLGEWGPFQQSVFFFLCFTFIPNGFTALSIVFIGDTPAHRCLIPAHANVTTVWINSSIPLQEHSGEFTFSKCSRYKLDAITNFSEAGLLPSDVNLSHVQQEPCLDGWEYDHTIYVSTIVSEWDLVCDDKWKGPLTSSVFFGGILAGSFFSGLISDRFGRKKVMFSSIAIQTVFSLSQVLSPSWPIFCVLHFVVGAGAISNYVSAFVIGIELFNTSVRTVFSTLGSTLFFDVGYLLIPLMAYYIRDWRMLILAFNIPTVLYVPFWWLIPESPRWLLSQGRVEEAEDILRQAAKRNNVQAPLVIFEHMHSLATALEMTGKFGATVAFALIFAYTAELYPTVLRNTAIGSYSPSLPYILIGTFTVLAALISLLIPESYGKPLPDSIIHMQEFLGCCKKNKLHQTTEEKPIKDPASNSGII
ncbi:hypothetical protein CRUP_022869 [Coryphaenoides rupestris]|nr:hypothetical protein CRUP_022869 [Coryphaenoides rupestris]